jgi:hypothetical protein
MSKGKFTNSESNMFKPISYDFASLYYPVTMRSFNIYPNRNILRKIKIKKILGNG